MIFIVNLLIGLLGTAIAGIITSFILVGNPSISANPSLIAIIGLVLGLLFSILGLWSGVSFVSKRSQILMSDVAKITLSVGGLGLLVSILRSYSASGTNWILAIVNILIVMAILWFFLKQKVK